MNVSYKKRIVKNLGNYETVTIEIGADEVVDHEIESSQKTYDRVREFVNMRLKEEFMKLSNKKEQANVIG
ncbi:MAG TPA: hypothetical protein PKL04_00885 [Methanofastidiosum sp.]|nr:hypothetical protein [Methanofastidiosum sp.]